MISINEAIEFRKMREFVNFESFLEVFELFEIEKQILCEKPSC